ncbi:MAG: hypothetical protein SNG10_06340 [Rikenellaceae bacterium]
MKTLKHLLLLLAIFVVPLSAEAQSPDSETPLVESQVDKIPTYKGQHITSFKMWILTNFMKHQEMLPDEFTINFIIERDGGVYHVDAAEESKKLALVVKKAFMNPPQFEPAIKDNKAVRYAISFTVTKMAASNGYTGLSVFNEESYIHHIGEVSSLPRLSEDRPFAELMDLMLGGGATKGVTSASEKLKFNLVCYKDGSH